MPRIARWDNLPANVRQHLTDRMRDRAISIAGLNRTRGAGRILVQGLRFIQDLRSRLVPQTFLLRGQSAKGEAL